MLQGCLLAAFLTASTCSGQAGPSAPEFEVASLRLAAPVDRAAGAMRMGPRGGPGTADPGRYECRNCSFVRLLLEAYGLSGYRIVGNGNHWMNDTRFDLMAKVPGGATKQQFQLMLQDLLAERLKLVVHHESREMMAYVLTVAKNGPKLKESPKDKLVPEPEARSPGSPLPRDKDGNAIPPPGSGIFSGRDGSRRFNFMNETMDSFARGLLSGELGRLVVDETGLTGQYDFILTWTEELPPMAAEPPAGSGAGVGMSPPGPPPVPAAASPSGGEASLIAAVWSQLGLKLESAKRQVDVLVIDSAEKVPTGN
jgi:uncharacterized protein (TIGR03435 family)